MSRYFLLFMLGFGFLASMLGQAGMRSVSRDPQKIDFPRSAPDGASKTDGWPVHRGGGTTVSDGTVEIDRSSDGHFYADVQINGSTVHMLIDTGASEIALTRADAQSAGLATSIGMNDVVGRGADGDVHGEVLKLDRVSLGHRTAEGLPAVVLNSGDQSLLGQSFLSQFDKVEIQGDTMLLH